MLDCFRNVAHKVNPYSYRLGVIADWKSRWFSDKQYKAFLKEDYGVRKFLDKKLAKSGVEEISIERSADAVNIFIRTAKPGVIIGRGGQGLEELKNSLEKIVMEVRGLKSQSKPKLNISVHVEEVVKPEISARIVGQNIAEQLERRVPFRMTIKHALAKVMQNKEALGAKIMVSGRLDGSEIARTEWLAKGRLPLTTLRANIDYAKETAHCTYGAIGIKVWIYKGEIFEKKIENRK